MRRNAICRGFVTIPQGATTACEACSQPAVRVHSFVRLLVTVFCEVASLKRNQLVLFFLVLMGSIPFFPSKSANAQTPPTKPLNVETLFQPGGLAGRGPETEEWSPDSTKLSFVQRDEKGE